MAPKQMVEGSSPFSRSRFYCPLVTRFDPYVEALAARARERIRCFPLLGS